VDNPLKAAAGLACASYDGRTPAAVIAEVTVGAAGDWRVDRIVCAVDCGVAINPLGVRAQVEGSVAWALSALSAGITLDRGRVVESTYRDFPILRFRDMPRSRPSSSDAAPTGMGEPRSRSRRPRSRTPSSRLADGVPRLPARTIERSLTCRATRSSQRKKREIDAPGHAASVGAATGRPHGHEIRLQAGVCGSLHGAHRREAARSCQTPFRHRLRTRHDVEALAAEGLKQAWIAEDVAQCGFQAGQIMQARRCWEDSEAGGRWRSTPR
jgi:hypothetical protein